MRVLRKEEFEKEKQKLVRELRECLFIHPTDTIYGLGCDATSSKLVRSLRSTKEQFSRPMSVIPPSKDWIRDNCFVNDEWLEKLPGPYTLIFKLKDTKAVARGVNLGKETIGVRMPEHWFSGIVTGMNTPVITTSANITGERIMTELEELDEKIQNNVKFAIYEGPKQGKPSTIVDLSGKEPRIVRA